jgi:hypothetical protein
MLSLSKITKIVEDKQKKVQDAVTVHKKQLENNVSEEIVMSSKNVTQKPNKKSSGYMGKYFHIYIAIRITIDYTKKSVFTDLATYLVKKVAVTGRTAPPFEAVPLIEEPTTSDEKEMSSDKPQTTEGM